MPDRSSEFMTNIGAVMEANTKRFFGEDARYFTLVFHKDSPEHGRFSTNVPKEAIVELLRKTADAIENTDKLVNMKVEGEA